MPMKCGLSGQDEKNTVGPPVDVSHFTVSQKLKFSETRSRTAHTLLSLRALLFIVSKGDRAIVPERWLIDQYAHVTYTLCSCQTRSHHTSPPSHA